MRLCFGTVDFDYYMRQWVWKYKKSPLGKYILVVDHEGQIVAHNSHIPVSVKVGKKILESCIGTNAMTHPKYRRRGLQWKLRANAHDELVKASIYWQYSFPGEIFQRHPGTRTSYAVCKIPVMMKIFDTTEIVRKLIRIRVLAKVLSVWSNLIIGAFFKSKKKPIIEGVKITKIVKFDDRINDFWNNVSKYFDIIVVRNKKYLNWRYSQRPDSNFRILLAEEDEKILGYIVFSSKDESGFIVDLLVFPHRLDVIQNLVVMAVEQLRKERVYRIICWMVKNNPYYRILRANGFIHLPSRYALYPLTVEIYSPSNVPTEFAKNPNNWYLTLGDTEGVIR